MLRVAIIMLLIAGAAPAFAQAPAKPAETGQSAAKRKPPKAEPVPKASQELRDAYAAMLLGERISIQSDLVWAGDYNGGVTGEFGDRAIAAVRAFQKRSKAKETGLLTPQERAALSAAVKSQQDQVGWRVVEDPVLAGARLGIPAKLVPQSASGKTGGRWSAARGEVQVENFRVDAAISQLPALFEQQKKTPSDRKVEYSALRPDFFVIAGLQGLKKFYVRAQLKDNDIRGMTILYDQAMDGIMAPVVVAMSSAFSPFAAVPAGPPPRRKVEYSTGIVVSKDGHIIADRQATDACNVIVTAHGHAERIADDSFADMALLRVYGANNTKAMALASGAPRGSDLTLVGIADPQLQAGGGAVTIAGAKLGGVSGTMVMIEPVPAQGFTGAAALDAQGNLVGMIEVRDQPGKALAALVPAATIRKFLEGAQVTPATGRTGIEDARESVARVICVRK